MTGHDCFMLEFFLGITTLCVVFALYCGPKRKKLIKWAWVPGPLPDTHVVCGCKDEKRPNLHSTSKRKTTKARHFTKDVPVYSTENCMRFKHARDGRRTNKKKQKKKSDESSTKVLKKIKLKKNQIVLYRCRNRRWKREIFISRY